MTYGMYDTLDNCWLGENETGTGPSTFEDMTLAILAADVTRCCLRWEPNRIQVREFPQHQALRLKDEVKTHMTPLEAIRRRENG